MKELDPVALTHNVDEYDLKEGDVGAIVHVYDPDNAFEVEFVTAQGETIAILTLTPSDIRPITKREILHVREMGDAQAQI